MPQIPDVEKQDLQTAYICTEGDIFINYNYNHNYYNYNYNYYNYNYSKIPHRFGWVNFDTKKLNRKLSRILLHCHSVPNREEFNCM